MRQSFEESQVRNGEEHPGKRKSIFKGPAIGKSMIYFKELTENQCGRSLEG